MHYAIEKRKFCKLLLAVVLSLLSGCGGAGGNGSGNPISDPSAGGKSGTGGSRIYGTLSENGRPAEGTVRDLTSGNETQSVNGEYELLGVRLDTRLQAFNLEVVVNNASETFELPFEGTEEVEIKGDFEKIGDAIEPTFELSFIGNSAFGGNGSSNNSKDDEALLSSNDTSFEETSNSVSRTPNSSEKEASEEINLGSFLGEEETPGDTGQDFNF